MITFFIHEQHSFDYLIYEHWLDALNELLEFTKTVSCEDNISQKFTKNGTT